MKAEALDDDLHGVQSQQDAERDRIRVLRASYAYLTASDQLQPLAVRHLGLEPIRGGQMVGLADLPERAPVPVVRGQEPSANLPAIEQPHAAETPERRPYAPPPVTPGNPPWLKAQRTPVLQPVGLPSQKRSSL